MWVYKTRQKHNVVWDGSDLHYKSSSKRMVVLVHITNVIRQIDREITALLNKAFTGLHNNNNNTNNNNYDNVYGAVIMTYR